MPTRTISREIIKKLKLPRRNSHKGDNGGLLIVAGNKMYFGAMLYAVKAASRIVDLIYVLTTPENRKLVENLKSKTGEFMIVNPSWLSATLPSTGEGKKVDCVLIGPGMGKSKWTYKLVEQVLKSKIRVVLDADALNCLDAKLLKCLNERHILTPHAREFKRAFGVDAKSSTGKNVAMRYGCTIVLKGKTDIIATPDGRISWNKTGNEGMTKGGTGDVLAGLIAAFFCENDALTSAAAGAYLNGLAGDELYKKVGPYYNAEDLVEQIPKTLWRLIRTRS